MTDKESILRNILELTRQGRLPWRGHSSFYTMSWCNNLPGKDHLRISLNLSKIGGDKEMTLKVETHNGVHYHPQEVKYSYSGTRNETYLRLMDQIWSEVPQYIYRTTNSALRKAFEAMILEANPTIPTQRIFGTDDINAIISAILPYIQGGKVYLDFKNLKNY